MKLANIVVDGAAIEILPGKHYVIFADPRSTDLFDDNCSQDYLLPEGCEVTVIPCIPPKGQTVRDCVATREPGYCHRCAEVEPDES